MTAVLSLTERARLAKAPHANISFQRIAVTPEQIETWNLPSRPTKQTDSRAKGFSVTSDEFDAIASSPIRTISQPTPFSQAVRASGSLLILASRTTRPVASTTHRLDLSSDRSIPA
jgi:hypothetical protein